MSGKRQIRGRSGSARHRVHTWVGVGLVITTVLAGAGCYTPPPPDDGNIEIDCVVDETCEGTVEAEGSSITVFAEAGSATTMTIGVNNSIPLDCPDYTELNPNQYLIDVPAQDRPKTVTITIEKSVIDAVEGFVLSQIEQCYGAPTPFMTNYGDPAPFNPDSNEYEGLLDDCGPYEPFETPCLLDVVRLDDGDPEDGDSYEDLHDGDVVVTSLLPGGDPRMK